LAASELRGILKTPPGGGPWCCAGRYEARQACRQQAAEFSKHTLAEGGGVAAMV
jgi:hypothetical protein